MRLRIEGEIWINTERGNNSVPVIFGTLCHACVQLMNAKQSQWSECSKVRINFSLHQRLHLVAHYSTLIRFAFFNFHTQILILLHVGDLPVRIRDVKQATQHSSSVCTWCPTIQQHTTPLHHPCTHRYGFRLQWYENILHQGSELRGGAESQEREVRLGHLTFCTQWLLPFVRP